MNLREALKLGLEVNEIFKIGKFDKLLNGFY
jgi:hypothetical protein